MKKTRIFDLRATDLEGNETESGHISRFGQFATDLTEGEDMIADIDLEEPSFEPSFKKGKEENIESVVFSKIEKTHFGKEDKSSDHNKKHLSQLNSILEEMVSQMIEEKVQKTINKIIDDIGVSISKMKI